MIPIGNVRDKFSGRIFLLGNGPSLLDNDLSKLDKEEVLTMNRSGRDVPNAKFHLASGDLTVLGTEPEFVLFYGQESMYPGTRLSFLRSPVILIRVNGPGQKFKEMPSLGIPGRFDLRYGWGVTAAGVLAVYAAWWLGYREIYLLGYDGYGAHYTDRHCGDHIPNHAKNVPEFVSKVDDLMAYDSSLKVVNLNPKNTYGNLAVDIFDQVC